MKLENKRKDYLGKERGPMEGPREKERERGRSENKIG